MTFCIHNHNPICFHLRTGADKSDPIMIQTNEDNDVEPQEYFELSLVTANGDKISTALVRIHDDDGEDTLYTYSLVELFFGSYPGYTDISQFFA